MAHAHQEIQQTSEIVFCVSTASLDRFNTSIFILSTASTLAVMMNESTLIQREFEMVRESLPPWAFIGNGPNTGPEVFIITTLLNKQLYIK